jgi:hypothetical protein
MRPYLLLASMLFVSTGPLFCGAGCSRSAPNSTNGHEQGGPTPPLESPKGEPLPGTAVREPYYCRLSFGPSGKVRVLIRLEANAIALQRRVGEHAVGKEQRFDTLKDCEGVTVEDLDGKTTYVIRSVEDLGLAHALGRGIEVVVDVNGPISYHEAGRVQMARQPEKAPLLCFHSPLVCGLVEKMENAEGTLVWKPLSDLHLVKGDKPRDLYVTIRNKAPKRGSYVVVMTTDLTANKCLFPDGVRPKVDVEFPPATPGAKPVKRRYDLDRFC